MTAVIARHLPPRLRALAVLHPFPSILNAVLVGALFLLGGGPNDRAAVLALSMLGIQFATGATNDAVDAPLDAAVKPSKPIPSGLLSRSAATVIAVATGALGLLGYATFGTTVFGLALAMLGCGLAYDLALKRLGLGWLCFAVAFPLLPVSTWLAAAGTPPPRAEVLLPVASLAGPMLQLANGLVDLERDRGTGIPTLAVRLGRSRALPVLTVLVVAIYGVAWLSLLLLPPASGAALAAVALATALAVGGLALSTADEPGRRERGWQLQAVALALLAVGWLLAAS